MKRSGNGRWRMVVGFALLATAAVPLTSLAGGGLELSLVVGSGARYVAPDGHKIVITKQPTQFSVQVRNASDTSRQIWSDQISGTLSKLRFELKDEQGVRSVVSQKVAFGQGRAWVSRYLSPGEVVAVDILLTPAEWDNVVAVPPGEVRHFTVRAAYQSESQTLYSDDYEVTIAPPALPGAAAPPPSASRAPAPITVVH